MTLKKIVTKHFPFSGYIALTFYPWIFIRESALGRYTDKVERHETTHALQQVECLWVFFLLIYGIEYIIKLPLCGFDHKRAYRSISFEQEAYAFEDDLYYNKVRKHYAWMNCVFTVKK